MFNLRKHHVDVYNVVVETHNTIGRGVDVLLRLTRPLSPGSVMGTTCRRAENIVLVII